MTADNQSEGISLVLCSPNYAVRIVHLYRPTFSWDRGTLWHYRQPLICERVAFQVIVHDGGVCTSPTLFPCHFRVHGNAHVHNCTCFERTQRGLCLYLTISMWRKYTSTANYSPSTETNVHTIFENIPAWESRVKNTRQLGWLIRFLNTQRMHSCSIQSSMDYYGIKIPNKNLFECVTSCLFTLHNLYKELSSTFPKKGYFRCYWKFRTSPIYITLSPRQTLMEYQRTGFKEEAFPPLISAVSMKNVLGCTVL